MTDETTPETENTSPSAGQAVALEINPELKNIIEAALLVAGQPLTIDKMLSLFRDDARPARDDIRAALNALSEDCAVRGVELLQIDNAWRFQSKQKYAEWLQRLSEERPVRYSRALLETLAIIAYRQPVTRGEIEDIRGVAVSSEIIKTLLGREWIRQIGTRDVPGRPALYGTTRGFLEHFNLKSLDALPPLAELRDIEKIAAEMNFSLPMGDAPPAEEGMQADVDADADADADNEAETDAGDAAEDDSTDRHTRSAESAHARDESVNEVVAADPGTTTGHL
jgi:segregation and condensation protein B